MIAVDGAVNFDEYKKMMEQEKNPPSVVLLESDDEKKKKENFALFDKDNNGIISSKEIHEVLSALNFANDLPEENIELQVQEIMLKHDTNGDGVLTFAGKL